MSRVLFIDLSFNEDFSEFPKRYGGCARTLFLLAKNIPNSIVVGVESSFENSDLEDKFIITAEEAKRIRETGDISCLPDLKFDKIVHCSPNIKLKTDKPTMVWAVGFGETVHPENLNLLLHNSRTQNPIISNPNTKIFEFILGIKLPEFKRYEKHPYILQVSNHYPQIGSTILADLCNKYQIQCFFAGPIAEGYDLLNHINNIDTVYLGVISEENKIELMKGAAFFASLYGFPINEVPLSIKSALSYGCPILTASLGEIGRVIRGGISGAFVNTEEDFVRAWNGRNYFYQENCYETARNYSLDKMVATFKRAIDLI